MSDRGTFKKSGIPILYPGASVFGDVYFVAKFGGDGGNAGDGSSGKNPDAPWLTVNYAMTKIGTDDTIVVGRGQFKEDATIAFTSDHHNSRLIADAMPELGGAQIRTEFRQYGNVDTPVISIEGAHNVEVGGFRITPYDPGTDSVGINVGITANTYGVFIHRNYFYGVGSGATGPCGIQLGLIDTYNADSVMVYRNKFRYLGASNDSVAQVMWNYAHAGEIRENHFYHYGNTANAGSIRIDNAAGMRGGIYDNRFINMEVALKGSNNVAIANPTAAGGGVMIDRNMFINFASDDNCVADMDDEIWGLNWNNEAVMASDT